MIDKSKHVQYIKKRLATKDFLYYLTEPSRITTIYWGLNALRLLKEPLEAMQKKEFAEFVLSCYNQDGGFGGTSGYPSTVLTTFHALQVLYLLNIPIYSPKTINFIISNQVNGSFVNDKFGEKDTRFDCCAVLSLKILSIMEHYIKEHLTNCKNKECKSAMSLSYEDVDLIVSEKEVDETNWMEDGNTLFFEHCCGPFDRNLLSEPISHSFLKDNGFDVDAFILHLLNCYNPDGGFGQQIGSETHAAQIFCVLSALQATSFLHLVDRDQIENFLLFRQNPNGGFNGRINKKEDVCYSFWVLSSLRILESDLLDKKALKNYILSCEGKNGAFSDRPGNECDLYHQMFSLASLSMLGIDDLAPVDPGIGLMPDPITLLKDSRNKRVRIHTSEQKRYSGVLKDFDLFANFVLLNAEVEGFEDAERNTLGCCLVNGMFVTHIEVLE